MSEEQLAVLGILSVVVNTIGLVPYVRDIIRKKTKPERATWWIWLALNAIAFAAQLAAGATWSLLFTAGIMVAVALIAILSLRYGYGSFHRKHIISLAIAACGILLWKLTRDPMLALLVVIFVDFLAFYLTITKTWKAPETETLSSWVFAVASAALGLASVGGYANLTKMIYPLYILLGNGFLVWVILFRRRHLSK